MKTKRYSPTKIQVKEVDRENFRIRFILSTPAIDRHGEVIDQNGWKLENYIKNPVVLWSHDNSLPAIGKMVDIGMVNGNLEGTVQFAYKENPDAAKIFDLVAGEYINAGSVGFMNDKWMFDEENDLLTLLENELLEFSIVNVPANADALAKARAKGLDTEVVDRLNKGNEERFKDLGDKVEFKKDETQEVPTEEKPEEQKPEEKPEEKPADDTEGSEPTDEEVKAAVETLCKCKPTQLKEAIETLTGISKGANKDKVETTPNKGRVRKFSTHEINRAIRVLLNNTQE